MTNATPTTATTPQPASAEQRNAALHAEVARLSKAGWTTTSTSESQAVLQRKRKIGWFWNTLLTIVTGGLWLIVIAFRLANRKLETKVVTVDAYGRVSSH